MPQTARDGDSYFFNTKKIANNLSSPQSIYGRRILLNSVSKADTIKSHRQANQHYSFQQILADPKISQRHQNKNMTTNFCYRCAVDTEQTVTGRTQVCSKCGLSESKARRYVNTEVKTKNLKKILLPTYLKLRQQICIHFVTPATKPRITFYNAGNYGATSAAEMNQPRNLLLRSLIH